MKLKYFFKQLADYILEFIYPKHCAVCDKTLLKYAEISLCDEHLKCNYIPKCVRDDRYWFEESVSVLKYDGNVKDVFLRYKFGSIKYYAPTYAYLISEATKDRMYLRDALMCNVPLSYGRDREYNQTALIAKELSAMWKCEYEPDLLYKCREVNPLSKMKLPERRFYIEGAIDVNPEYNIYGKDIVLIDDIFTSGTTANECAKVLKMYGARKVYVLCACYD